MLEPLTPEHIRSIVMSGTDRWLSDARQDGAVSDVRLADDAVDLLVRHAYGDARRALNAPEAVLDFVTSVSPLPT